MREREKESKNESQTTPFGRSYSSTGLYDVKFVDVHNKQINLFSFGLGDSRALLIHVYIMNMNYCIYIVQYIHLARKRRV
jgi:hypothetical protein